MTTVSRASARPAVVSISFLLWLLTVMLGVAGGIVLLIGAAKAGIDGVASFESVTGVRVVGSAAVLWAAGSSAIVLALVELLVVAQMLSGHGRARIILVALAVLQSVSALLSGGGWLSSALPVLTALAAILMLLPWANRWFRRTTRVERPVGRIDRRWAP